MIWMSYEMIARPVVSPTVIGNVINEPGDALTVGSAAVTGGVPEGVEVTVAVGPDVGVFVGVFVAVPVGVFVGVFVEVRVAVAVGVFVGVPVGQEPSSSVPLVVVPDAVNPSATITRPSASVPCA